MASESHRERGGDVGVHVFIDTNILLSFFHYTNEDLEEIKKLVALVEKGKIELMLPQQVIDEFKRNRESKIADALKGVKEQSLSLRFPQACKDYEEYEKLRGFQREYQKEHAKLIEKVEGDANRESLKADQVVSDLFKLATIIPTTDSIYDRASRRVALGNPPGKNGSLGDAVNWEALLDSVPVGEALHFVTDDRDFVSPLTPESVSSFLLDEWTERKESELALYKRLSEFFAAKFPEIKLASQVEQDLLIGELAHSDSFLTTHSVVRRIMRSPEFTAAQANAILAAAMNNSQVGWIANDHDVRELLLLALAAGGKDLDPLLADEVRETIHVQEEAVADGDDEIPF